jgi:hypothetical protein
LQDSVSVLVEETVHVVHRDDLTPLDELEALSNKAKGGCTKHDSGGCDCRHHGPKTDSNDEDDGGDFDD